MTGFLRGRRWWLAAGMLALAMLVGCGSEQEEKQVTIGVINLGPVLEAVYDGFKAEMTELGYVEGENVVYLYDGPIGSIDRLDEVAQNMVDAEVDLILALSTPSTLAAQRATSDIPIIFAPISDPVNSGLVPSLMEPGGNATGVTWGVSEPKRLEWLMDLVPGIERIYVPYNPEDTSAAVILTTIQETAAQLDVELVLREARTDEEITAAVEAIPDDVQAIFLLPDTLVVSRIGEFVAAGIERKIPLSAPGDNTVEAGGLVTYSMRFHDAGEQVARMADQILNGADPAEMPVQTTEFFLTINLETAEAIGLEVSDSVLQQADTIIR